ncbi:MAG TPA: DUF2189 domain-containing protein, partial [Candidatus Defluviicoccus seviourii]|nr:DUF2189 domain-containing protein [Candidatus Defluviicoccus seviourii]
RQITDIDRSGRWLAAGWRDFLAATKVSLIYGAGFVILGNLLTLGLWLAGLDSLILPLAGGFIILGPLLVVGLYDVSRRLEVNQPVTIGDVFAAFRTNLSQLSAIGVVLLIAFLVWIEVALFLFMLFFSDAPPPLDTFVGDVLFSLRGAPLLLLGTLVGALFAAIVFSVTAVSVPLIYDRPFDVVTAISISLLCVQLNYRVMFGWAGLIAVLTAVGLVTGFLGLLVAMPVLAFSTWHAYRDLIEPAPAIEEEAFPAAAI